MPSVDDCAKIIQALGWVFKESVVNNSDCPEYWRIDCASRTKSITVLAPVRSDAWNQAVETISRIEEEQ